MALVNPREIFGLRDFRLFLGSRFLSMMGAQMQSVAIAWHVYDLTRRPLDLGFVGLALFLPMISFSLVTGHVADRFDRRRVMLVCYAAQTISYALLLALVTSGAKTVYPIYAVLFLIGTARAFGGPAGQALLPSIVPIRQFSNAVAWGSSVWQLALVAGPAVGGIVYGASNGGGAVYAVATLLSLLAWLCVFGMKIRTGRMDDGFTSWHTLLAGVRYVWTEKVILGTISLDLFAVLLGGAVALLPVYARDILHVGPTGLGMLRCAPALGAAMMAIVFAYHPLRRKAGATMLLGVFCFGLATIGFGLSENFVLSLVLLVVIGASDMVSVIVRQTVVQLATPPAMRGRVSAVSLIFVGASNELGEFESGVTAAWLGTVPAVVVGGIGTCLVVAIWALMFKQLRRVDRLDKTLTDSEPPDPRP